MKKHNINRRDFIKSAGACTLCTSSLALIFSASRAETVYEYELNSNNEIVVDKAIFSEKKQVLLAHPESKFPISLLHLGEDKYSALLMMCTHQKGTTEWVKDHYLCPNHGARYTERGDVLRGPTTKKLKSYSINVTDKEIIILLT